jgi:hypothetical protein
MPPSLLVVIVGTIIVISVTSFVNIIIIIIVMSDTNCSCWFIQAPKSGITTRLVALSKYQFLPRDILPILSRRFRRMQKNTKLQEG